LLINNKWLWVCSIGHINIHCNLDGTWDWSHEPFTRCFMSLNFAKICSPLAKQLTRDSSPLTQDAHVIWL
jgi:hypothetical protein